jgi:hypothetical protein
MSSLVNWPVYPRLRGTMQGSECARNSAARVAAARFFWMLANGAATASQQTSAAVSKALARSLEASGGRGFR